MPSLIRRRRVGLADEQAGQRAGGVEVVVGEHADGFELGGFEHVGFVDGQDRDSAAFGVLAGEQVHGLGGEGGVVGFGEAAERGDDGVVDPADADRGVAEVDEGVPGGVQGCEGGAQGHGLAGADFPGDHAEGVLADAPGDPGGCLGVGAVAVQHARCQVAAERHFGEPVVGLEFLDTHRSSSAMAWPVVSWPGGGSVRPAKLIAAPARRLSWAASIRAR
jgi:hypothetical protein